MTIIYHFGNPTKGILERFKYSYDSLKKNKEYFDVGICEIGKKSSLDYIKSVIEPCYYYYEKQDGIYNPSIGKNRAVQNLVKTPLFCFLDADIIVSPTFVSNIEKTYCKLNKALILNYYRLPKGHEKTSNYFDLLKYLPTQRKINRNGGIIVCSTYLYQQVNGFDEEYIGWGGRDTDFNHRLRKINKIEFAENILVFHQHHFATTNYNKQLQDKNLKRYKKKSLEYNSNTYKVFEIKGLQDLRRDNEKI